MRTEFLCISVLRVASEPRVKLASCKSALKPPVVYSTDRSGSGPGVSLTLCCFVVYSTRRFVLCLTLYHFVLVFFSSFSIAITLLGEERTNLSAFRTFVRFVLVWICRVSSSSWGLERAAVCDRGTPWTFLLIFFQHLPRDLENANAWKTMFDPYNA